jgi:hypothetical protein
MPYDNEICPACDQKIDPGASVAKRGDAMIHASCIDREEEMVPGTSTAGEMASPAARPATSHAKS